MSRKDDLRRAESWRVLAFSALRLRNKFQDLGLWADADLAHREFLRRAQHAHDWQVRADAPWWKRWFR